MNEEFVKGISLAVKRGFLSKEEGKMHIQNMIVSEENRTSLIPVTRRLGELKQRLEWLENKEKSREEALVKQFRDGGGNY